jgi:hypothetical protein
MLLDPSLPERLGTRVYLLRLTTKAVGPGPGLMLTNMNDMASQSAPANGGSPETRQCPTGESRRAWQRCEAHVRRPATQRNATHRGAVLSSGSASRPSWDKDVAGLDMTGSESPRAASVPCSRRDCRDFVRSRSTRLLAPPRPDAYLECTALSASP